MLSSDGWEKYVSRKEKTIYWYTQRILALIYWVLSKFWYKLELVDQENAKDLAGPIIIISNHKSRADQFFIGAGFPNFWQSKLLPIRIMAKDPLFEKTVSGTIFWAIGTYPTYYKQGMDVSLKIPQALLKNNEVVGMYPEGRRVYTDEVGEFKRGVGELVAKMPSVPILPVAIYGTRQQYFELLPKFRTTIKVVYGKPFHPEVKETSELTTATIRDRFLDLYNRNSNTGPWK